MSWTLSESEDGEVLSFSRAALRALVREVALEAQRIHNDPDTIADSVVDALFTTLRIEEES